jgi:hypothetical protein
MHIQTLIAKIIHPKVKHIHKNPPPILVHERERAKKPERAKILECSTTSVRKK